MTGLCEELIAQLSDAPDGQLSPALRQRCRDFSIGDPIDFIKRIRLVAVHTGGASTFVIAAIDAALAVDGEL